MYGMSQRTPVNAFMMVMIMITRNAKWTSAAIIAQKNTRMPPIPGIAPNTACTTAETMLKRNHAQPKMIDCMA